MNIRTCCLIFFLFSLHLQAQQISFEHFTSDHGLSQSTVNCIVQDRRGFLWVGTENGLNRFDGYQFIHYENEEGDSASLSNNAVKAILEDREGFLWVGTMGGLNRFDPATETFQRYQHDPNDPLSLAFDQVHSIFEDAEGGLWIGASVSLERFDRATGKVMHFLPTRGVVVNPGDLFIKQIIEFENHLYLASWGEGVLQYDPRKNKFTRMLADFEILNGNAWVDDFNIDVGGTLWAVINGYALEYDPQRKLFLRRFSMEPMDYTKTIIAFHRTKSGHFLAGLSGRGLQIFTPDFRPAAHYWLSPDSTYQYNNFVSTIFEDRGGEIWLGTLGNGLFKFDPGRKQFGVFPPGIGADNGGYFKDVLSILETQIGEIWTASRSHGIQVFDKKNRRFTHIRQRPGMPDGSKSTQMKSLFQDSDGRIWVGTWGDGVKMFDPRTGAYRQFVKNESDPASLPDNFITSFCETKERKLWVTTFLGAAVLDLGKAEQGIFQRHEPSLTGLRHHEVTSCFPDRAGRVWFGTRGGLDCYDPASSTFRHFSKRLDDPNSLNSNRVSSIFEDSKNRLWVGTLGGGLNRYDADRQRFLHFTAREGLPSNAVQGIVQDADGFLWITTDRGLAKFDPETEAIVNVYRKDDLPDDRFNPGAIGVSRSTGEIFAGSVDGFVLFHPDSIHNSDFVPPVAIASLKRYVTDGDQTNVIQVKGISALSQIELPFSQNTLTFEFAALNFRQAFKNQYAYKLEGMSDHWIYLGNNREVTFSQLPPGRYTLHVKASNNDGVWNEQGASLKIAIRPPWYRTWWAYALYVLAAGGIFYFLRKKELQAQRLRHRLELERVAAEKLKEVDQLKSRLYTNITHEFRTPLTVISGMAGMIEKPEKSKELIQRNSEGLLRLVNQMLDLAKLESGQLQLEMVQADVVPFVQYVMESFQSYAASKQIRLVFQAQVSGLVMDFDENKLQSILSNLLSNAIKFTPEGGSVELSIGMRDSLSLLLTVTDTGTGIPEEKLPHIFDRFYQVDSGLARTGEGTGIGLTLVQELVELMKGTIRVESKVGQGTAFTLRLPVSREAPVAAIQKNLSDFEGVSGFGRGSEEAQMQSPDLDQPLLLIIEDNADLVTYVRSILQDQYNILVAENGAKGIEKAFETIPDIILSDLMMPEKDGFEVTQTLKNDERTSHIPVVLLTAKADVESRIAGLKRGADAYLSKPFHKEELLVVLEKLVELRKKLQEKYGKASPIPDPFPIHRDKLSLIPDLEDAFLIKIGQIMEEHLEEAEFSVAELCHAVGFSQPQLYRKIKALTGQSIVAWMRSFRLHKALILLQTTSLNVSEIAYQVGFSDPAYFSRAFSEEFGEPPGNFRK